MGGDEKQLYYIYNYTIIGRSSLPTKIRRRIGLSEFNRLCRSSKALVLTSDNAQIVSDSVDMTIRIWTIEERLQKH